MRRAGLQAWASDGERERRGGGYERLIAQTYVAELVRALRGGDRSRPDRADPAERARDRRGRRPRTIASPQVLAKWADERTSSAHYSSCRASRARQGGGALGLGRRHARRDAARVPEIRQSRGEADRQDVHRKDMLIPLELVTKLSELGVFGADNPRGVRRARTRQDRDVRRHRGAVARLHRRRLARDPRGDRGGADPRRRHRRRRRATGSRRSPPARCSRPRCSPSRITDRISRTSRRARCEGRRGWDVRGRRRGSPTPAAPNLMTLLARTKPEDGRVRRAVDVPRAEDAR